MAMTEIINNPEQQNEAPSLDGHLYHEFSKVASFEAYEYLDGNKKYREEQKRQFLAGEIENPILDYPNIDLDKIDHFENSLIDQKRNLLTSETNEVIKQAYRWRINEKIAEARMLKAVAVGNMHRFKKYSEYIYGKPSEEIFAYTINSIADKAQNCISSDDSDLSQSALNLINVLPKLQKPQITELPDKATVSFAKQETEKELGDLIDIPEELKRLDAEQIQEAFNEAINKVGDNNWKVIIDNNTNKTAVTVSQEKMQVNIPAERNVTRSKLCGLILHEIGTHVARRINGERSKLKLLGLGLDRYDDEGIATMREQVYAGKVDDFRGIDGLLAIGLANGTDGQPRDFRQVYTILEKYYLFNSLRTGKDLTEASEKASNTAWKRTVRTFRGTGCKTPGTCFTKDIIYRNGNIGVWDVIKNNPEEMMRFNVGKYDPANPRHIWILEQLGISDQDLTDLDK